MTDNSYLSEQYETIRRLRADIAQRRIDYGKALDQRDAARAAHQAAAARCRELEAACHAALAFLADDTDEAADVCDAIRAALGGQAAAADSESEEAE